MNYWPPIDGVQEMFDDDRYGSSEIMARRLARSTIVKAFNHIGYHELESERGPPGAPDRRAHGVAGDAPAAVATVAAIVDRIGYDVIAMDSLRTGRAFESGAPVFGASLSRDEFALAVRPSAAA